MFRAPLQIDLPSTCSLLPFSSSSSASSSLSSFCSNSGLQFSTEASTCTWKQMQKIQSESKKVWFVAHDAKLYLFVATLLNGVLSIFFENVYFFLVLQWPKKIREPFFTLKIKGSEKRKCVNKMFLSKSKIYKD